MIKNRRKLPWILVLHELGDGYPLASLSLRSILAPQAGPQPLSLAFQLQQQVYISICPTIIIYYYKYLFDSETDLHN